MIHLPAREMRTADIPLRAIAVRCQDECALLCADQYSYFAHRFARLDCRFLSFLAAWIYEGLFPLLQEFIGTRGTVQLSTTHHLPPNSSYRVFQLRLFHTP